LEKIVHGAEKVFKFLFGMFCSLVDQGAGETLTALRPAMTVMMVLNVKRRAAPDFCL
jgi:hypothetical protein